MTMHLIRRGGRVLMVDDETGWVYVRADQPIGPRTVEALLSVSERFDDDAAAHGDPGYSVHQPVPFKRRT